MLTDSSIGFMDNQLTGTDQAHMRRALELAEGGPWQGQPESPGRRRDRPRRARCIGEGFHAALGDLHAERAALADCAERGADPAGATMYVTLEPCAHEGRQPPCVDAILEAGIARVVIASDDPSEKAAGRGPGILRDGGVEVELRRRRGGDRRPPPQPAFPQARPHRPAARHPEAGDLARRPHRHAPGDSPWISGEKSQALVHRWRAESDAIAVGIGTVLADDPLLTARGDRRPPPAPPRRLRPPGPPAARLPSSSAPSTSRPSSSWSPQTRTALADRRCARRAPRSWSPTTSPIRSRRPRPPRHHLALPRGRPNPRRRLPRRRADRRVPHLRRPRPAGRDGSSRGWRGFGGPERRRSPRPQAPPKSCQAPRAYPPCPPRSRPSATTP